MIIGYPLHYSPAMGRPQLMSQQLANELPKRFGEWCKVPGLIKALSNGRAKKWGAVTIPTMTHSHGNHMAVWVYINGGGRKLLVVFHHESDHSRCVGVPVLTLAGLQSFYSGRPSAGS